MKEGWTNRDTGKKGDPRLQFNSFQQLQDVMDTQAKKLTLQLNIKDLRTSTDSSTTKEYKINRFKEINIYADYKLDEGNDSLQTIEYQNYKIHFKDKLKYRPKALTDAIFFEKDNY